MVNEFKQICPKCDFVWEHWYKIMFCQKCGTKLKDVRGIKMKKVTSFRYNSMGDFFEVGKNHVTKITYHCAAGEGDRHYCEVFIEGGIIYQVFNIDIIRFELDTESSRCPERKMGAGFWKQGD